MFQQMVGSCGWGRKSKKHLLRGIAVPFDTSNLQGTQHWGICALPLSHINNCNFTILGGIPLDIARLALAGSTSSGPSSPDAPPCQSASCALPLPRLSSSWTASICGAKKEIGFKTICQICESNPPQEFRLVQCGIHDVLPVHSILAWLRCSICKFHSNP
jgi:hypothetical protein